MMLEKAGINWVEFACATVLMSTGQVNWEIHVQNPTFTSLRNTRVC